MLPDTVVSCMPSFLDKVNRTMVAPELLGEAMQMHAEMPVEDRRVFEGRSVALFQMLTDKGFKGRRHVDLAIAIEFRLQALSRLVDAGATRGWTLPGDADGRTYLHADLVWAAAREPLVESADKQASFDSDGFSRRLLELTEAKGQA